jgi:hypothetical protein
MYVVSLVQEEVTKMKPILKWQYDQLVKELILLQEHQADPHCPCETAGEMCVRKHLLTIEAYAQETLAIEDDHEWRHRLDRLALEAKTHREAEEKALCGGASGVDVLDWSRLWRKEFEAYSLGCDLEEHAAAGALCPLQYS